MSVLADRARSPSVQFTARNRHIMAQAACTVKSWLRHPASLCRICGAVRAARFAASSRHVAGGSFAALSRRSSSRCMVSLPATTWPLVNMASLPSHVGNEAAGFAHQDDAGGEVPWREIALPIGVEPAGGDPGEIECGGAIAAQPGEVLLRGGDFLARQHKVAAADSAAGRRRPRLRQAWSAPRRAGGGRCGTRPCRVRR